MRPRTAKVGSVLKKDTITMKVPLDFRDSLCSLFLRNLPLVAEVTVFATICLPRFSRYSCSYCSWGLVVPLSKVDTAWTSKTIPNWHALVVLHVPPVSAEICRRRASILALILDAGSVGVLVITMLPFLLWRTPIGSASLLLHLVCSLVMILYSLGSLGMMSGWLPVEMIRSLSSLG